MTKNSHKTTQLNTQHITIYKINVKQSLLFIKATS